MRTFLVWFGWISVVGSVGDGAIAAWLGWLVLAGDAPSGMSVDAHLRDHLPWLYWVRDVAEVVLPQPVVEWVFGLPALVYFPVRVGMSIVLGWWALSVAARMKRA